MKFIKTLILFAFSFSTIQVYAQSNDLKYNIELLGIYKKDSINKNVVDVIFYVTPKKMKDFPPILSMRIGYGINTDSIQKVIDLQKQEKKVVSLVIYGESINEKNPALYAKIKDKVNFKDFERIQILAFNFKKPTEAEIKSMTLQYGLWEKNSSNKRTELKFKGKVE